MTMVGCHNNCDVNKIDVGFHSGGRKLIRRHIIMEKDHFVYSPSDHVEVLS